MKDWNVVVNLREGQFRQATRFLGRWGPVSRTSFYNVLVLRVANLEKFIEELGREVAENPRWMEVLARVSPVVHTFDFQTREEFGEEAGAIVLTYLPELAYKGFHVRMHRRGLKKQLSSKEEERRLGRLLLEAMMEKGAAGQITFEDPEMVLVVETVGNRGGISLRRREDWERFPLLAVD